MNEKLALMLDQALISAANFTTGFLIAIYLGLSEFGDYTLIISISALFQMLHRSLITTPMLGDLARHNNSGEINKDYSTVANVCTIVFALSTWGITFLLFKSHALANSTSMYVLFSLTHDYVRRALISEKRHFLLLFGDCIRFIAPVIIFSIAYKTADTRFDDVASIVIVLTICSILSTILSLNLAPRYLKLSIIVGESGQRIIRRMPALAISTLSQWAIGNIHFFFAAITLGSTAVGIIRGANNLVSILNIIFQVIDSYYVPKFSYLWWSSSWVGYTKLMTSAFTSVLAVTIAVLIAVNLISNEAFIIMFGNAPDNLPWIMAAYSMAYIVNAYVVLCRAILIARKEDAALAAAYTGGCILLVFLLTSSIIFKSEVYVIVSVFCAYFMSAILMSRVVWKVRINDYN